MDLSTSFSIRCTANRRTTACPITGERFQTSRRWGVFSGGAMLSEAAALQHAPELAALVAKIPDIAGKGDVSYAIASTAHLEHGDFLCREYGETFRPRRPFDIFGIGSGKPVSPRVVKQGAPALHAALVALYGTDPVDTPAPPTLEERKAAELDAQRVAGQPTYETARQYRERVERERSERRAAAVALVAGAIGGEGAADRAEKIVAAVELLTAA